MTIGRSLSGSLLPAAFAGVTVGLLLAGCDGRLPLDMDASQQREASPGVLTVEASSDKTLPLEPPPLPLEPPPSPLPFVEAAVPETLALADESVSVSSDHLAAASERSGGAASEGSGAPDGDAREQGFKIIRATDFNGELKIYDAPEGSRLRFRDAVFNPTYYGNTLTLLVSEGSPGDEWVEVDLPVRPNGSRGWVRTRGFGWSSHNFRVVVDRSERTLTAFEGEQAIAESRIVVGRDDRPTPLGSFIIDEKLKSSEAGFGRVYGTRILTLSGYSEVLEVFNGGLPKLAIHGTFDSGQVGQALSSGCIRVPNEVVEFLERTLPVGTVVDIVA